MMNHQRPLTRSLGVAVLAVALFATATACSSNDASSTSTVASAPSMGAHVSAPDFAAAVSRAGVTVVDVRTPAEFASGHLQGAVNIDIEGPDFTTSLLALPKDGTYAVYCRSGNRSGVALQQMANAGFTDAFDLTGGIGAWTDNGGQLVA